MVIQAKKRLIQLKKYWSYQLPQVAII